MQEGLEKELEAQEHFVLHGESLMQTVRPVAGYDMFLAGEEVFPDPKVGRQENLDSEELCVGEEDHPFLQRPDRE